MRPLGRRIGLRWAIHRGAILEVELFHTAVLKEENRQSLRNIVVEGGNQATTECLQDDFDAILPQGLCLEMCGLESRGEDIAQLSLQPTDEQCHSHAKKPKKRRTVIAGLIAHFSFPAAISALAFIDQARIVIHDSRPAFPLGIPVPQASLGILDIAVLSKATRPPVYELASIDVILRRA